MPEVPERMTHVLRRRNDPVVVQTFRSTVAAVLAYVAALRLTSDPAPLLAPLTALLVVQVTLYATLTNGMRRVVSVVAGVLIAVAFSELVGLTWWSLGLLILASLVLGRVLRVEEYVPEVAISGMLVLGVTHVTETAYVRVAETVIGAVVGTVLNLVLAPPVFVQPASAAIEDLAGRMHRLLTDISCRTAQVNRQEAVGWLHEARRLDQDIVRIDGELSRAEESTRLNPRVRQGELARLVLRSGLDTLEICAVVLRTLCRSLADLAIEREGEEGGVYPDEVAAPLCELLNDVARAVDGFGRLITAQVSASAERAEEELAQALLDGRAARERIARLLVEEMRRRPDRWQLQGALLANIDRLLDELDVERRSQMLAESLDRYQERRRERRQQPQALWHRIRGA
ncbi:aromatic acid exporter family protein [Streptacidiphilus sp. ASG 303]|uniref:aromatic acid exporter family protein n=1 Tax=Streptacidiphilus sp. ASG 303 TaxID=2896847 RepID=UPI001E3D977E|nr:aromatic acid exporter family protein [Streptacidiphilus sp. ASG 303]MCD0481141.1 aromatic acid exporter family protein [Streptacidiphilus sp. ASG 303]